MEVKKYSDLHEGQILYLSDQQDFWELGGDSHTADGIMPRFTKVLVHIDDSPEIIFKVLDGEFEGKLFMWGWNGVSEAKPEDLLTEEEFIRINEPVVMWKEQFSLIKQCPQRQDAALDQLEDLYKVAVRLGFYDAADAIKNNFFNK